MIARLGLMSTYSLVKIILMVVCVGGALNYAVMDKPHLAPAGFAVLGGLGWLAAWMEGERRG